MALFEKDNKETPDSSANMLAEVLKQVMPAVAGSIAESVKQAVKSSQLTPDMLNELKKPYVDPIQEERRERDRLRSARETKEQIERREWIQGNCSHNTVDPSGSKTTTAIGLMHFQLFADPIGICQHCLKIFMPRHIEIDARTQEQYIVEADPQYARIQDQERAFQASLSGV